MLRATHTEHPKMCLWQVIAQYLVLLKDLYTGMQIINFWEIAEYNLKNVSDYAVARKSMNVKTDRIFN